MKKSAIFLCVGVLVGITVGAGISLGCSRFLKKNPRMYYAREDIIVKLNTDVHVTEPEKEKLFTEEIVIPKGTCLNDDGGCDGLKFLKVSLVFDEKDVPKYFNEGRIKGNYFLSYGPGE